MREKIVSDCVESLCRTGCAAVRATITTLEKGLPIGQTDGLSDKEKQQVLSELKTIMSVYDSR